MKSLDLKGKKFRKLTPIEVVKINNKRGWKCLCDCGNYVDVPTFQLTAGYKTSCGCGRSKIQKGDRFGKLVVQKVLYNRESKKDNKLKAEVLCDCGKTKTVFSRNLTRGCGIPHCGCMMSQNRRNINRLNYGEASRNSLILNYKNNAKNKKLTFKLSNDELEKLFKGNCYYCGTTPIAEYKRKNSFGGYIYNGIDRLDSNKGYLLNNVVSCCSTCNYLKNKYTETEFLEIIMKIANHRGLLREMTEQVKDRST